VAHESKLFVTRDHVVTHNTSFALEMMLGSAIEHGNVVGMISVEDDASVTGARLLGAVSGVSSREIQRDEYAMGKHWAMSKMVEGIKVLNDLGERFLFEDQIGGHELDICASMSRMAMKGARMVIVDYIGEVLCSKAAQDRRNEIRIISKRLKAHARRLGVVLVLLSQITVEKQGDSNVKAPSKHALRESRDLANSAETVLMLWREKEGDWEPINATIVKSKWGGVNEQWKLKRSHETGRIEELGA
jgi:replicative DNA helicase